MSLKQLRPTDSIGQRAYKYQKYLSSITAFMEFIFVTEDDKLHKALMEKALYTPYNKEAKFTIGKKDTSFGYYYRIFTRFKSNFNQIYEKYHIKIAFDSNETLIISWNMDPLFPDTDSALVAFQRKYEPKIFKLFTDQNGKMWKMVENAAREGNICLILPRTDFLTIDTDHYYQTTFYKRLRQDMFNKYGLYLKILKNGELRITWDLGDDK